MATGTPQAPYQVVQQVFTNAVTTATTLQTASAAQIASISSSLSGLTLPTTISVTAPTAPTIVPATVSPLAVPTFTIGTVNLESDTHVADFGGEVAAAQSAITAALSTFFTTYFPMTLNDTELTLGQGWVINVLTGGGAMNPTIETQYWQRDRDRLALEANAKIAETTALWASRGFALPPGAAVGAVAQAQRAALEQSSESSRSVAIKKYETEVQLQQVAIQTAIDLRTKAMGSLVEYIRTLVMSPRENAEQYSAISAQATKAANDAMVSYFASVNSANTQLIDAQARINIATTANQIAAAGLNVEAAVRQGDLALRGVLGTADIAVRQNIAAGGWSVSIGEKKVDAVVAGAQFAATMASAALNGIHATAGVQGSSSDNTQYYG